MRKDRGPWQPETGDFIRQDSEITVPLALLLRTSITAKNMHASRMFSKTAMRICGTVKNVRRHKYNVFVDIDDGNRVTSVIIPKEKLDLSHNQINCGSSASLGGDELDAKGQLICSDLFIDNSCDSRVSRSVLNYLGISDSKRYQR